jgi:hypothetical protein
VLDHLLPSSTPLPSPETIPETTRINLETSGKLKGMSSVYSVPVNVNGI